MSVYVCVCLYELTHSSAPVMSLLVYSMCVHDHVSMLPLCMYMCMNNGGTVTYWCVNVMIQFGRQTRE